MKRKTVLVTGGTTRLGRALAEDLRARGWRVLTTSHRADAGADILADFADPLGPARAYAACLRLLDGQPPDALVNNAALFAETLRVNAVAPGPVLAPTDVHEKAGETLLGRPTPADVAQGVAYLLEAAATTGAVLPIDGGQHLLA